MVGVAHVGVDINAPEGTPVAVSREGTVIHIDDDHPEEGGWGPRVIIQLKDLPIALIYTHLDPEILCKVGDILRPGTVFAKIGPPSHNGGWFSHLHVQALSQEALAMFKKYPGSIDGYMKTSEIEIAKSLFPDPMAYVHIDAHHSADNGVSG